MQNFYVASSMKLQNSDRRFQLAARVMFYSESAIFLAESVHIFQPGQKLDLFCKFFLCYRFFAIYCLRFNKNFIDRNFACRPFISIFGLQRSLIVSYFSCSGYSESHATRKKFRALSRNSHKKRSLTRMTNMKISSTTHCFHCSKRFKSGHGISLKQQTINVHALNTQCALLEVLTDIRNRVSHQLRQ